MKNILALFLAIVGSCHAIAEELNNIPTHCKSGEFSYLNARMAKIVYSPKRYDLVKNGKVLSICADKEEEPFGMIAYRYGKPGAVELEEIATANRKFNVFSIEDSPVGNNIIFFNKGNFTYYVSEATNQGHGVHLFVYKSGKRVFKLFSGNDAGIDYEAGLIGINFENPSSLVLKRLKPRNVVW